MRNMKKVDCPSLILWIMLYLLVGVLKDRLWRLDRDFERPYLSLMYNKKAKVER
jgi:hypothetical protein